MTKKLQHIVPSFVGGFAELEKCAHKVFGTVVDAVVDEVVAVVEVFVVR